MKTYAHPQTYGKKTYEGYSALHTQHSMYLIGDSRV